MKKIYSFSEKTVKHIFVLYITFLLNFVVVKFFGDFSGPSRRIYNTLSNREIGLWNINLIPLKSISDALDSYTRHGFNIYTDALIYNILLFIPLGLLIPFITKKQSLLKTFFSILLIIIAIEVIQFITCLGIADIDDVILNLIGSAIGFMIYKFVRLFYRNKITNK